MKTRVLVTDGKRTVYVAWVEHTGIDVYAGIVNHPGKWTYHESGQYHWRAVEDAPPEWVVKCLPLKEVEGTFALTSVGFSRQAVTQGLFADYTGKPSDAVLYVDLRTLPDTASNFVNISLALMEPGSSLAKIPAEWPLKRTQVLVATAVEPWVCVSVVMVDAPEG